MLGKENHERQIIKLLFKTVIEPYLWAVHINSNPLVEYQNHQVAKNTKQKQNLQNKDSTNKILLHQCSSTQTTRSPTQQCNINMHDSSWAILLY